MQIVYSDDFGTDTDGLPSLAFINVAADLGLCEIKAVCCSSPFDYGAAGMEACMIYSGRPTVPLGAYQASDFNAPQPADNYGGFVRTKFQPSKPARASYPTALSVAQTALAACRSGAAVYIEVGPPVNLRDLLAASGGAALIAAKCSKVVIMGGTYPGGGTEYNFGKVTGAIAYVVANCPVPIVFIGSEVSTGVTVGIPGIDDYNNTTNPYRYGSFNGNAASYDPIAVYAAIWGVGTDFALVRGTCAVNSAGTNSWTDSPTGPHYYVSKLTSNALLTKKFNELFQASYPAPVALSTVRKPVISMAFEDGVYRGAATSDLACVRAVGGTAKNLAGSDVAFSANQLRITDRGLYLNADDQITINGILKAALSAAGPATVMFTMDGMTPGNYLRMIGATTGLIGSILNFGVYQYEVWNGTTALDASPGDGTDWSGMSVSVTGWNGSHRKAATRAGSVVSDNNPMGDHTALRLGQNLAGGENMVGFLRRMDIWDAELTDNEVLAMARTLGYQYRRRLNS